MKRLTKSEKSMLQSCFTYGETWLESRYIAPIVERVGEAVVLKELNKLADTYTIQYSTYTDSEGCTYNTLVAKN